MTHELLTTLMASFAAGLTLGLASALHCAAMCGCIASSLLIAFEPGRQRSRLSILLEMQLGRVAVYVGLGAAVGVLGSAGYALVPGQSSYKMIQTAAAISIVAVGLWTAGLLPIPELASAAARGVARRLDALVLTPMRGRTIGPAAAGLIWGANPCPMVLAALLSAALTGTGLGGATLMAGFGLGTVPAVVASAYGVTRLARLSAGGRGAVAGGLLVAAAGVASIAVSWNQIAAYCLSG